MKKMITICAWCKGEKFENKRHIAFLEKTLRYLGFRISHGVCKKCATKYL